MAAKRRKSTELVQVAALPVRRGEGDQIEILLVTSRETRRWIIPKGWRMPGKKDHQAAAVEAREEAGVEGRVVKKPLQRYRYWKRRSDHFVLCTVKVFALKVENQLETWKEMGQRDVSWFAPADAALLVDEPGLADLMLNLHSVLPPKLKT